MRPLRHTRSEQGHPAQARFYPHRHKAYLPDRGLYDLHLLLRRVLHKGLCQRRRTQNAAAKRQSRRLPDGRLHRRRGMHRLRQGVQARQRHIRSRARSPVCARQSADMHRKRLHGRSYLHALRRHDTDRQDRCGSRAQIFRRRVLGLRHEGCGSCAGI